MLTILNKEKKVPAKIKLVISLVVGAFAILAVAVVLFITVVQPRNHYKDAVEAMNSSDYDTAISMFEDLDSYKDSEKLKNSCKEGLQISSFIYRYNAYAKSTDGVVGEISTTISESPDESYSFKAEDDASIVVQTEDYKVVSVSYGNDILTASENFTVFLEVVSAIMEGMDYSLSENDRESILTYIKEYNIADPTERNDLGVVNGVEYDFYIFFPSFFFVGHYQ